MNKELTAIIPQPPAPETIDQFILTRLDQGADLAFDAQLEIDAIDRMPYLKWQQRVDRMLQAYILEHVVEEDITYYDLKLARDEEGNIIKIFAPGFEDSETGEIEESFAKAKGRRVAAENSGFSKIKRFAAPKESIGRFFVHLSPPGAKEEGYPGHNFAFIGIVMFDRLAIAAYRNWLAMEDQINFLNQFLEPQKQLEESSQDIDLLKAPVFLPRHSGLDLESTQINTHLDVVRMLDTRRFEESNNDKLLRKLAPLRTRVIRAMYSRNKAEVVKAMYAHENIARAYLSGELSMDDEEEESESNQVLLFKHTTRDDVVRKYDYYASYAPPVTNGSCGKGGVFFSEQLSSQAESFSISNSKVPSFSFRGSGGASVWLPGVCRLCSAGGFNVGDCQVCQLCEDNDNRKVK